MRDGKITNYDLDLFISVSRLLAIQELASFGFELSAEYLNAKTDEHRKSIFFIQNNVLQGIKNLSYSGNYLIFGPPPVGKV